MIDVTSYKLLQNKLDAIHELMYESPGNFYIKDLRGRYLFLNVGVSNHADCDLLGKTDFDAPWGEYAGWYQKCDSRAIVSSDCVKIHELLKDHEKNVMCVSTHKKPFYSNGELIGACGVTLEIPVSSLNADVVLTEKTTFIDVSAKSELVLTGRQRQILYWVLRGYSVSSVANHLCISFRTVEHHLAAIRESNAYTSLKEVLLHVRLFSLS